jgi:3-isopropylmalate/(R)-2-methylmalate dehydratase small subunit
MKPFTALEAVAVPIDHPNLDTDQIIPARFLGLPRASQVGVALHDLRFDAQGGLAPDFAMNQEGFVGARIIVGDSNFGCGSSRENAVTVLLDNGFIVFIAPSFGDIFYNNCFQNGALPVRLDADRAAGLRAMLHANPGARIKVDLVTQTVIGPDGAWDHFEIDSFRKDCLLRGVDEIKLTLSYEAEILAFEARQSKDAGWLDR